VTDFDCPLSCFELYVGMGCYFNFIRVFTIKEYNNDELNNILNI